MYWWIPMLAGAALGAMKNGEESASAAEANKVEAVKELYSPWTGVHSKGNVKKPSLMGDLGSGMLSGAAMGQSFNNAEKADTSGAATPKSAANAAVDSDFNKYGTTQQNLYALSPEERKKYERTQKVRALQDAGGVTNGQVG